MANRTPGQIQEWLDGYSFKMDLSSQYIGDEPNAVRREWDTASARWCMVASWPYQAAAGNQSIPAVYKSIHHYDPSFLCDRFYLPATPRDLRLFERHDMPVFGIESKHQLRDFDVVATSVAYPVLVMSFHKMLTMSDIPVRWRDRAESPGDYPMVMMGGLAYTAPEVMAPIADAIFCGEAEDEPGNPGIGAITARIAEYKTAGLWRSDRIECYRRMAREFPFLYFPRFIDVQYGYEDRSHVGVGIPEDLSGEIVPSKQVVGYTSNLEGMRLPIRKRHVRVLDSIPPLDDAPLLYGDPQLGAGGLEAGRGCPAWKISDSEYVQTLRGTVQARDVVVGDWVKAQSDYREVTVVHPVLPHESVVVRTKQGAAIRVTPEHELWVARKPPEGVRPGRYLVTAPRSWVRADEVQPGDYVEHYYGSHHWPDGHVALKGTEGCPSLLTEDVAWFLGMVTGDAYVRHNTVDVRIEDVEVPMAERLRVVVRELFGVELTSSSSPDGPTTHYRLNSAAVVRWLGENFDIRANDTNSRKIVPAQVLRSGRAVVAAYMSALYDCNGSHRQRSGTNRCSTIEYTTYSETQARGIALCLNMLGLPPVLRSEVRNVKRDGSPAASPSVKWEVRHQSARDGDYTWLVPLSVTKSADLDSWVGSPLSVAQGGLLMAEVVSVDPGPVMNTIDLTVPGDCARCAGGSAKWHGSAQAHAFNVSGVLVSNCSFCHLSFATKPYRQHGVEYMTKYARQLQQNSGAARFSPYMPDFPMYTERKNMISDILTQVSDEVDAAAMRVDDFNADKEFILLQVHGGMSGVTLGLEGGSARMRDLVGKGTSDSDVEEAVYSGIRAGIRRFKIFMISNLPGEDEGDIFRVLRLARKLADIRDNLNQPQVQIQFSWTPLLIEAGTPFQWFAPTSNNLALRDVWDEFRELKINFKIGGKVEVNKISFFQLCQRASREVGEAMVDTMDELGVACWGGVPKNTRELLEKNLRKWGFHNGLEDCFDERFQHDMFGWEFIDSGISSELLWTTYQQMREFVEQTDSHTYDEYFDEHYHGGEFIRRCDEACLGKTCGVCTAEDLKERTGYVRAAVKDRPIDLSTLDVIDQKSVAFKIRMKVHVGPKYRFVENDHWRFSVRRAAFRAAAALGFDRNHGISKRTLKFVSDEINYKNWTCGTDYIEFGMTRKMSPASVQIFIDRMNEEMLIPNGDGERWLSFGDWTMHPAVSRSVKSDVDLSLFEMELLGDPEQTLIKIAEWGETPYVKLLLKKEGAYFNPQPEEVNAKDYVDDMWLIRDGHRIKIRMMTRGKPTPYILYAVMMGQSSWLPLTANPVVRIDSFVEVDKHQQDILRPSCVDCENQIPTTVLDKAFDADRCPKCLDAHNGVLVTRELVN